MCDHTGLTTAFDAVLSVDAVRIYKPAPPVYDLALQHLGGARRDIIFLSANGFDVAGATTFGFTVWWVNRTGAPLEELGVSPDATIRSLDEITSLLAPVSE